MGIYMYMNSNEDPITHKFVIRSLRVFVHGLIFDSAVYLVAPSFYWWKREPRYYVPGKRPPTIDKTKPLDSNLGLVT